MFKSVTFIKQKKIKPFKLLMKFHNYLRNFQIFQIPQYVSRRNIENSYNSFCRNRFAKSKIYAIYNSWPTP